MIVVLNRLFHAFAFAVAPSPRHRAIQPLLLATMNDGESQERVSGTQSQGRSQNSVSRNKVIRDRKAHHLTVCMIPPAGYDHVWDRIGAMRKELRDPGYFRWPPHVNLLYPFLDYEHANRTLQEVAETLHTATKECPPFQVSMNAFGTFGGKQRGVLWLYPDSSDGIDDMNHDELPLMKLYDRLVQAFPMCDDLSKKASGRFNPHMTLSHFENLDDAETGKELLKEANLSDLVGLDFLVDRIYLMERQGDGGQFERLAEVGLGPNSTFQVFDPPKPFPWMPEAEEDWVYEERMKLKARRNGNGRRGKGHRSRRRSSRGPRVPDPPEVIAAKRAERKAKRERLEMEQVLQAEREGGSSS